LQARCPSCGAAAGHPFYELDRVPVHQVKLVRTRKAALACAKGDIALCFCPTCGFVWNAAFEPARMRYGEDYESTQAVSPTFNAFHARLAKDLIERFDLFGKQVVEIGCGQGEFVTMLAELGGNQGYGFDRVHRGASPHPKVEFVKDFYGPRFAHLCPDFVCCKMTLEHVHDTLAMLQSVRRTLGERPETVVLFMIPEVTRILRLSAFWDIYYEHCSYWSPGALARAFRKAGFDPIALWCDYGDQYVLIAARPGTGRSPALAKEEPPEALAAEVKSFAAKVGAEVERWRARLEDLRRAGQRTALWGGGSKAVAFLTTLGATATVAYAVDVNPRRHGTFIAGTAQKIVAPAHLAAKPPDALIVMSPIYLAEIQAELDRRHLRPTHLLSVETPAQLDAAA
jgi:SAM-dependent methyltransferase